MEVNVEDLPSDWDAKPPALTTQIIGEDFMNDYDAAVLKSSEQHRTSGI